MLSLNSSYGFIPFSLANRSIGKLLRIALDGRSCSTFFEATSRKEQKSSISVSLGPQAASLAPDFFQRLHHKIGESEIVHAAHVYLPRTIDPKVDWNDSCVISTNDRVYPQTYALSPCIAILMRAYAPSNPQYPAYLSVTHVFSIFGVDAFESSLQKLILKTHNQGIQIFLCRGYNKAIPFDSDDKNRRGSNSLHRRILKIAHEQDVAVVQDLVGLADAQGTAGMNQGKYDFYVLQTGFDSHCNPYAIIEADTSKLLPIWFPKGPWHPTPDRAS